MQSLDVMAFEGHRLTKITWKGAPAWLASEVSKALGYADPKTISRYLSNHNLWGGELIEGEAFEVVRGKELALLKELVGDLVTGRSSAATILLEDGMWGVMSLTKQAAGKSFRRWWRREVMPALVTEGSYTLPKGELVALPNPEPAGPVSAPLPNAKLLREERLLARELRLQQAEDRRAREGDAKNAEMLRSTLEQLNELGCITPERYASYLVRAAEVQLGEPLNELRPRVQEILWLTPTRIGGQIGCSSAAVGRAISNIVVGGHPLRGHPGRAYCRALIKKRQYSSGDCTAYEYSPAAFVLIRNECESLGYLKVAE